MGNNKNYHTVRAVIMNWSPRALVFDDCEEADDWGAGAGVGDTFDGFEG